MRKIVSLALCAALACALLVGCGGGSKKIPPENFPHSETLRLDATPEEIIAAEKLIADGEISYKNPQSVMIDGVSLNVRYVMFSSLGKMGASYSLTANTNVEKQYKQLSKYFSDIYGEPSGDIEELLDFSIITSNMWVYSLDQVDYFIAVIQQPNFLLEKNGEDAFLTILVAPMELFDL